jgi:hypothetical protein
LYIPLESLDGENTGFRRGTINNEYNKSAKKSLP